MIFIADFMSLWHLADDSRLVGGNEPWGKMEGFYDVSLMRITDSLHCAKLIHAGAVPAAVTGAGNNMCVCGGRGISV